MELSAADDRDPAGGSRRHGLTRRVVDDIFSHALLDETSVACKRSTPTTTGAGCSSTVPDRTDEPFEAYLLEVLSDFQVSIPELGAVRAAEPPVVVITSNRTREIHDAITRRCLYHWVDFPNAERELAIVRRKCPRAAEALAREIVAFAHCCFDGPFKAPGIAETLDWTRRPDRARQGSRSIRRPDRRLRRALLKYQDDIGKLCRPRARRRLLAKRGVSSQSRDRQSRAARNSAMRNLPIYRRRAEYAI